MSASSPGQNGTLSVADRKQQLARLCAADRAAWVEACRNDRRPAWPGLAKILLGGTDLLGTFLPGRLGRWYRGAHFVTGLFRHRGGILR